MMLKITVCIISVFVLTSCISSRVTSNVDPFYKGAPKERFLFVMESGTPDHIAQMEQFARNNFADADLVAVPYSKAMPPVREYTDEEKAELLRKANVQAYVRMRFRGAATTNVHIPSISYTQSNATATGGGGYATARGNSATVTSGGYSREVITGIQYDCEVQDAESLKTIWTGYISIDINSQNRYVGADDYFEESVQLLVKQLVKDRIAKNKSPR